MDKPNCTYCISFRISTKNHHGLCSRHPATKGSRAEYNPLDLTVHHFDYISSIPKWCDKFLLKELYRE
jgi:hypothetical protein